MRENASGVLLMALLLALLPAASAEVVWHKDAGWVNLDSTPKGAAERFAHACALMTDGNYAPALEQLEALEKGALGPTLAGPVKLRIVECLLHLERCGEGIGLATRLIASKPPGVAPAECWQLRYLCARRAAQTDPAAGAPLLDAAAAEAPDNASAPAALWSAAEAYARLGRRETAMARLEELRRRFPADEKAVPALRRIGEEQLELAIERNAAGELPQAAAASLGRYLELRPEEAEAATMRQWSDLLRLAGEERDAERRRAHYAALMVLRGRALAAAQALAPIAGRKGAAARDLASYYRIVALKQAGRLDEALQAAETFLEQHQASARHEDAVRELFDIGVRLLDRDDERGLQAMDSVFARGRQGAFADDALLEKGKYLLRHKEHVAAKQLFEEVREYYPARETSAEALFRLGQSRLGLFEYHSEREQILSLARESFELYARDYPHGPFAPQAQELARQCRALQAERLWSVAQFYLKRSKPEAAAIYMERICADFPGTAAASRAKGWLEQRGTKR